MPDVLGSLGTFVADVASGGGGVATDPGVMKSCCCCASCMAMVICNSAAWACSLIWASAVSFMISASRSFCGLRREVGGVGREWKLKPQKKLTREFEFLDVHDDSLCVKHV